MRSSELLVTEGFQVNVALLPEGSDPDTFVRTSGGKAYAERLTGSQPYLEFLLDRAAQAHDVSRADGRKAFLSRMLAVAATIPDAADRDRFADRLAHKARVTESVVRDEIRKAAVERRKEVPAAVTAATIRVRPAELGLLWTLVHHPVEGLAAVAQLEPEDLEGLVTAPILQLAASLSDVPPDLVPGLLLERLSEGDRALLERARRQEAAPAPPSDCVQALHRGRTLRDLAAVQDEIDRLPATGAEADQALAMLWERKKALLERLEQFAG
jgi:DNA primase